MHPEVIGNLLVRITFSRVSLNYGSNWNTNDGHRVAQLILRAVASAMNKRNVMMRGVYSG
jgi:hypothetical protein